MNVLSLIESNPQDYAILQVFVRSGIGFSEHFALTREDVGHRGQIVAQRLTPLP